MRRLWHKHKVVRVHEPLPEGVLYRESHHMPRAFSWPMSIVAAVIIAAWTSAPSSFEEDVSIVWLSGILTAAAFLVFAETFALWVEVKEDRVRYGIRPFIWHALPLGSIESWRIKQEARGPYGVRWYRLMWGGGMVQLLEMRLTSGRCIVLEEVRAGAVAYAIEQAKIGAARHFRQAEVNA